MNWPGMYCPDPLSVLFLCQGRVRTYSDMHRGSRFIIPRSILRDIPKDISPARQKRYLRKRMAVAKK